MTGDASPSGWTCSECGVYVSAGRWHPISCRNIAAATADNERARARGAETTMANEMGAHGGAIAALNERLLKAEQRLDALEKPSGDAERIKDVAGAVRVSAATIAARQGPDGCICLSAALDKEQPAPAPVEIPVPKGDTAFYWYRLAKKAEARVRDLEAQIERILGAAPCGYCRWPRDDGRHEAPTHDFHAYEPPTWLTAALGKETPR